MSANFKKYVSIVLAVCFVMVLVSLAACKYEKEPEVTTPQESITTPEQTQQTTPQQTTPEVTTPSGPVETVTFPSNEDNDPKQEDVFFE